MTALPAPFSIPTTQSTAQPKATKTLPKATPKILQTKSAAIKKKSPAPSTVTSEPTAAKLTSSPTISSSEKPGKATADSSTTKSLKPKKAKLVRDSFTIPKPEYLVLDNLKLRAAGLKHPVKKGELLRAGIKALAAMTDSHLLTALQAVPALKTGRPSK